MVKDVGFYVVHALCLVEADVFVLLLFYKLYDGIDTSCAFCGVRVGRRHVYAKLLHALLPCYGMIGH